MRPELPESPVATPMRECLDFLLGRNVETILDAGCGSGVFSLFLARMGFLVEGFDTDEAAVARAREQATRDKLAADFQVARWDAFPYEYDVFDAAVAVLTLDCITPRELAIGIDALAMRIRRGGSLFALFHPYDPAREFPIPYRDNELRRLFLGFRLMQFQSYSGGYRGLFFARPGS